MMKELKLLLKPVSADCNMRCSYCFYMDEAAHREIPSYGKMTQETMRSVVHNALHSAGSCVFGFQGGEPTLAGIDFYKQFTETVNREKGAGQQISYTIQTNGLLINEAWADFFKKENFLVGISLDGTRELHDINRRDAAGKGTYARVLKNARLLQSRDVPVNILCVLTRQNARKVRTIYQTLKKQGFYWQQYIPCLEPMEEGASASAYTLTPKEYAEALKTLFDLWFADRLTNTPVFVRDLDNWLHVLKGGTPEACAMYGRCTMQNVTEANGNVYPCDFYALDQYCMGNIKDYTYEDLQTMSQDPARAPFFQAQATRGSTCPTCRWYPLCRGGCLRDYIPATPQAATPIPTRITPAPQASTPIPTRITPSSQASTPAPTLQPSPPVAIPPIGTSSPPITNRWCPSYQEFFQYAIPRLESLASRIPNT